MKIRSYWWLLSLMLVLVMIIGAGSAMADRDEGWGKRYFSPWFGKQTKINNSQYGKLYRDECGSCHFPFQPGFLPAQSWRGMMENLQDHFGENAELSDEVNNQLLTYLTSNSADAVNAEIPNKVMWSLRYTPSPKRVTETAFFRHEHREIPPGLMQRLKNEVSFSNCDSCHTRAIQGSYNEHEIRIPGVGRWED